MNQEIRNRMKTLAREGAIASIMGVNFRKVLCADIYDSEEEWGVGWGPEEPGQHYLPGPTIAVGIFPDGLGDVLYIWGHPELSAGGRDVAWWDRPEGENRHLIGYLSPIEEASEISTDDARADLKEWHDWVAVEQHRIQYEAYVKGFRYDLHKKRPLFI